VPDGVNSVSEEQIFSDNLYFGLCFSSWQKDKTYFTVFISNLPCYYLLYSMLYKNGMRTQLSAIYQGKSYQKLVRATNFYVSST
jgi:hypothetical protein